jgi:hypothetical protein
MKAERQMKHPIANVIASVLLAASVAATPAVAQPSRSPPPGHEVHPPPPPGAHWDRGREPPPSWGDRQWQYRQHYLRSHHHHDDDNEATVGLIAGAILGFVLGAAIVDSQQQQANVHSRLADEEWLNACAQRYRSFDRYSGTYLGYDGLRHYCRVSP